MYPSTDPSYPYCVFWNQVGNAAEIAASGVGPNCFWRGTPQYISPAIFGGGCQALVVNSSCVESSGPVVLTAPTYGNVIVFSVWFAPVGWSYTNGVPSSGTRRVINIYLDTNNRICMDFIASGLRFLVRHSASSSNAYFNPGVTGADGEWHRLLGVYDRGGIGGGADIRRVYFDGNLVAASAVVPAASTANTDWTMRLGSFNGFGTPPGVDPADMSYDNPKIFHFTSITEDMITDMLANQLKEGFTEYLPGYYAPVPEERQRVLTGRRVMMGPIDLVSEGKIAAIPKVHYTRLFDSRLMTANKLTMKGINNADFFSVDNPASPFSNDDLSGYNIEVYLKDDTRIWDNRLFAIRRLQRNVASIESNSNMMAERYDNVIYTSAAWETPAEIFEAICIQTGLIDYVDKISLEQSKAYLESNECRIKLTLDIDSRNNIFTVFELLGWYGCADVFEFKGKIYYQVWRPIGDRIVTNRIANEDILAIKEVDSPEKYLINDYAIHYNGDGGTPAKDSTADDLGSISRDRYGTYPLKEVTGSSPFQVESLTAAKFIGNQHIKRRHRTLTTNPRPRIMCKFDMNLLKGTWLDMTTTFLMNYARESWIDRQFEIMDLIYDDKAGELDVIAFSIAS